MYLTPDTIKWPTYIMLFQPQDLPITKVEVTQLETESSVVQIQMCLTSLLPCRCLLLGRHEGSRGGQDVGGHPVHSPHSPKEEPEAEHGSGLPSQARPELHKAPLLHMAFPLPLWEEAALGTEASFLNSCSSPGLMQAKLHACLPDPHCGQDPTFALILRS